MRAIVTVLGKDRVGIISALSAILADSQVNILDITQTTMQDIFTMVMVTDISKCIIPFDKLADELGKKGENLGLKVALQHEDIFNSMHRI